MATIDATASGALSSSVGAAHPPAAPALCAHCGLSVPRGMIEPDGSNGRFCCAGCRTAWDVIHSCGLERFYDLAKQTGFTGAPPVAERAAERYGAFDDPAFLSAHAHTAGQGLLRAELRVQGVHCAACVWLLERLARAAGEGVVESRLDMRRAVLSVTWDPGRIRLSRIASVAHAMGYPVHPIRGMTADEARRRESRAQLARIGVAGAIMGNVMLVSFALYSGVFDGPAGMDPAMSGFFRMVSMGLGLVSLAWPGAIFFRGALNAVRTRTPSMDLPIGVGLALGGGWGVVNALRGTGEVYFDTITTLVFLLLLGRWIQSTQQRRSADAVERLFSLTPRTARLVDPDDPSIIRIVPVEAVTGDGAVVEVLSGEAVPVDGVVISGNSEMDVAMLTGESRPVAVGEGHAVFAGAVNLTGPVRVRASAAGESTRVGRLMNLVEDAARRRAPIVRLADRVAAVFVPSILALAVATAALWWFIRPDLAIDHAVALLITTCPCALGLATPLAVIVGIGGSARHGILIKGGDTLEALARGARHAGVIVLDKTGTITRGGIEVVRYTGDPVALRLAAALEQGTSHPVARAIVRAASPDCNETPTDVRHELGSGISGTVEERRVRIGSPSYVLRSCPRPPSALTDELERCRAEGLSAVLVALDGVVAGVAALGDTLRDDSTRAILALKQRGWRVRLLSGDDPAIVTSIGTAVGVPETECVGGVTPEGKLDEVRRLVREHPGSTIVMVGDGVNDAAALAAATVGIAVHGGAEASMDAADVYLSRPGLSPLVELLDGSARTLSVIRRNMAFSLLYNALFITLAVTGTLTPLIAAIVMPFSSLTVVMSSVRSRAFGGAAWE